MWLNNLFFNVGESWSCFYVRKRKDPKKRVRLKYQRSNQKMGLVVMVSRAQEKEKPQTGGGIHFRGAR